MKNIIYPLIIVLVILMSSLAIAISSPGVLPSSITVFNVQKGQEINTTLTIRNSNDFEENFSFNISGEIKDWISISSEDTNEQINDIFVPANDSKKVLVNFKIPADAPNKLYTSKITVQGIPAETGDDNTSSLLLKSSVPVSLYVVGEQLMQGEVLNITTRDIEINKILRIYVEFKNTGDVTATPTIDVTIKKNGENTAVFTHKNTGVSVGKTGTIEVEWDSTGQTIGNYSAYINVILNSKSIENKQLYFKILERGTLTAEGEVEDVDVPSEMIAGEVGRIDVNFRNIGQIDVMAKISGEVYKDNNLVDTIQGDETLIRINSSDTLTAYFKPSDEGTYLIKGGIVYEGKRADFDDITIKVSVQNGEVSDGASKTNNPPTGSFILDTNVLFVIFIAFAAVLIVAGILRDRSKRNRKGDLSSLIVPTDDI